MSTCGAVHLRSLSTRDARASRALTPAHVDSPYEYSLPSNLVVFLASLLLAFASWRRSSCCCASPCVALVCRRRVVVKGSSLQSSSRGAHGVRVEHRGPALVSEQHAKLAHAVSRSAPSLRTGCVRLCMSCSVPASRLSRSLCCACSVVSHSPRWVALESARLHSVSVHGGPVGACLCGSGGCPGQPSPATR